MKRTRHILTAWLLCIALAVIPLAACKTQTPAPPPDTTDTPTAAPTEEPTAGSTEPGTDPAASGSVTTEAPDTPTKPDPIPLSEVLSQASKTYTCGGDNSVYYRVENTAAETVSGIYAGLEQEGYTLYSEFEANGNAYRTYIKGAKLAHIGYQTAGKLLTVVTSTAAGKGVPANPGKSEVVEPSVTQIGSSAINGMGYIITLPDRSFLIIDGGETECAPELYKQLCLLKGSTDNIRIRAWLITHAHADHYNCLWSFSKTYGQLVNLECMMIGLPAASDSPHPTVHNQIGGIVARFRGGVNIPVLTVHTGMVFRFGDAEMQILYSPEELYAKSPIPTDFNESSVISRVRIGDRSAIFLGDAGAKSCGVISTLWGDTLRSDIVQIAHHGCETAPVSIYRQIAAPVLFWPCSWNLYNQSRNGFVKQQIRSLPSTKDQYIHEDGSVTVLLRSLTKKS